MSRLLHAINAWGFWPAAVMVFAQANALHFAGLDLDLRLAAITCAGTLIVYGADRILERLFLPHLGARHTARALDRFMPVIIVALVVIAFPRLDLKVLLWLTVTGLIGALYLAITTRLMPTPLLTKELVGALSFTVVAWGLFLPSPLVLLGFFLMGTGNFLWSSYADSARDAANELYGIAVINPDAALRLARICAGGGALFLAVTTAWPLWLTAAAHAFWPKTQAARIDLAFLLLAGVFLF